MSNFFHLVGSSIFSTWGPKKWCFHGPYRFTVCQWLMLILRLWFNSKMAYIDLWASNWINLMLSYCQANNFGAHNLSAFNLGSARIGCEGSFVSFKHPLQRGVYCSNFINLFVLPKLWSCMTYTCILNFMFEATTQSLPSSDSKFRKTHIWRN